jgi:hypothetical protein
MKWSPTQLKRKTNVLNYVLLSNSLSMKNLLILLLPVILLSVSCTSQNTDNETDSLKNEIQKNDPIPGQKTAHYTHIKHIPVPKDFQRIDVPEGSYADYLRNMELKTEDNIVYLYDGKKKWNQNAQFAVLKIDRGTRDLQQCADAVMRLRAEYLYEQKKYKEIHFNFLSDGKPRYFTNYAGNDLSYKKFRKYMDYIFSYANTSSLKDELNRVENPEDIQIGDVFIQKGRPYGHAVTVMDMAKNNEGKIIFMLSQSYMPAQDIHILKNPKNKYISPWYLLKSEEEIITPEWDFSYNDLMRF